MKKHFFALLLFIWCQLGFAQEIAVVQSDLKFPISADLIAQYVVVNMKLSNRYMTEPGSYKNLSFKSIYVASVIDEDGRKYVFVGIPRRDVSGGGNDGGYEAILQYCANSDGYEFASGGFSSLDTRRQFEAFSRSTGKYVPGADDIC